MLERDLYHHKDFVRAPGFLWAHVRPPNLLWRKAEDALYPTTKANNEQAILDSDLTSSQAIPYPAIRRERGVTECRVDTEDDDGWSAY